MPVGWVEPTTAPFYQSAYKKGLTVTRRPTKSVDTSVFKYMTSVEFILFVSWASFGNLTSDFVSFTWV